MESPVDKLTQSPCKQIILMFEMCFSIKIMGLLAKL